MTHSRVLAEALLILAGATSLAAQAPNATPATKRATTSATTLQDFQVIEFRRYSIKDGERQHFVARFESYFPEAIQQLGGIVFGDFLERNNPSHFTWMRGFHNMDARALANAGLYFGPVWKEHREIMNAMMTDSDNVLLLRPLDPKRGVLVLPAVDPVTEPDGAKGIVVAQIFAIKAGEVDSFAREAETIFESYRSAGAREAGVLVTLDAPNNFPQLPVRTDGPFLVWLGILEDDDALRTKFAPLAGRSVPAGSGGELLRGTPELIVLEPGHRSRLRWLP